MNEEFEKKTEFINERLLGDRYVKLREYLLVPIYAVEFRNELVEKYNMLLDDFVLYYYGNSFDSSRWYGVAVKKRLYNKLISKIRGEAR